MPASWAAETAISASCLAVFQLRSSLTGACIEAVSTALFGIFGEAWAVRKISQSSLCKAAGPVQLKSRIPLERAEPGAASMAAGRHTQGWLQAQEFASIFQPHVHPSCPRPCWRQAGFEVCSVLTPDCNPCEENLAAGRAAAPVACVPQDLSSATLPPRIAIVGPDASRYPACILSQPGRE